jgi:hypothetical protein
MNMKKLGWFLVVTGIAGVALSVLADLLPNAKRGIQATQILGIELSIGLLMIGLATIANSNTTKTQGQLTYNQVLTKLIYAEPIYLLLTGMFVIYIVFIVSPMFWNETLRMHYFITYLPDRYPIGNDLIAVRDLAANWFSQGISPYTVQFYPPFTYVFFAPLLLISDYPLLYKLFTLFNLICFVLVTLLIPLKLTTKQNIPTLILVFTSAILSYGLQFEIERGQYNVFTFLLCLWAIYIFHTHQHLRSIAYLLFSISIQLKIYPAIFIVMLVDDWRNWKGIIKRFAGLGVLNVFLLLIMGPKIFLEFIQSVVIQLQTPGWGWNGNHSIKAFIGALSNDGLGIFSGNALQIIADNKNLLANIILLITLLSYLTAIYITGSKNKKGPDYGLLLICMLGALTIPVSNDYTLSILPTAIALFFSDITILRNKKSQVVSMLATLGVAIAYFGTLIPFKYKPYILSNTYPLLFTILILSTLIIILRFTDEKNQPAITSQ